jgi:hypothetical protein
MDDRAERVPAAPALRWFRALVLATVAFALGVTAHLSSGGLVPGPLGLVSLFVLTTAGCAAFLGRAASTLRITGLVTAGQAALHLALTAASGHAGDSVRSAASHRRPPALPTADRRGSFHDAYERASLARADGATDQVVVPDWVQHLADDLTGPHAAMAVAHLTAAALVGLWLASGERALWALIRLSRTALLSAVGRALSALAVVVAALRSPGSADSRVTGTPARRLHSALLATTHARRGPPALLAV